MAKKTGQARTVRTQAIPDDVKTRVNEIVEAFNKSEANAKRCPYVARFQDKYLYLDRRKRGGQSPICRLKYTGKLDDWDFAIYKYSRDAYDASEWFFPGSERVNGTLEGAMKAGLMAYPPSTAPGRIWSLLGCLLLPVGLIFGMLNFVLSKLRKRPE